MSDPQKLVFYMDVVSPWTYVAFTVLQRYKQPWNLDLQIRPINLGYVMKFSGNKPPLSVQNKGLWMNEDMERATKFFGVTLNFPSNFPTNTFFAQSLLRLFSLESPSNLEAACKVFFEAVWHTNTPLVTAEELKQVLQSAKLTIPDADLDVFIQRAMSKEERNKLVQESEELVKQGCFGMPWMVATRADGSTSRWFGSDRFEQLAAWLGKEYKGPYADGRLAKI